MGGPTRIGNVEALDLCLIKPNRYEEYGYLIQWWRSIISSNSLAYVAGLVQYALGRGILKDLAEVRVATVDETDTKVRFT
jgi:hypothetical protein